MFVSSCHMAHFNIDTLYLDEIKVISLLCQGIC